MSEEDAKIKIQANDKERAAFNRAFTKTDGLDVRLYDLSINTSTVGLNLAAQVAIQCIRSKLDI
ncbi:MAG: cytidylate kinase family protein [Ethanoligenens sp.]